MVHAGCVFVAGIHPSRTGISGSFELDACVHRLDLSLYSHPKEFWGNRVRTHVNSKGEIPSPEEYRTHDTASSRTASLAHYQRAIAAPRRDPKIFFAV